MHRYIMEHQGASQQVMHLQLLHSQTVHVHDIATQLEYSKTVHGMYHPMHIAYSCLRLLCDMHPSILHC